MPQSIDPEIRTKGISKGGAFIPFRPETRKKYLLSMDGKEVEEILREAQVETTIDQHGYMRGVVIRMCCMKTDMFAGWEETDVYEYFANKYFFIPRIKIMNGKEVEFNERLSMATCGIKRSSEFIRMVIQELNENGIEVPEPSQVVLNKYSSKVK